MIRLERSLSEVDQDDLDNLSEFALHKPSQAVAQTWQLTQVIGLVVFLVLSQRSLKPSKELEQAIIGQTIHLQQFSEQVEAHSSPGGVLPIKLFNKDLQVKLGNRVVNETIEGDSIQFETLTLWQLDFHKILCLGKEL